MNKFGPLSTSRLIGVTPNLIRLAKAGLDDFDIVVVCGGRTLAEQVQMVQKGVSKTMNSMHLKQVDGLFHALDLIPRPTFDWNATGYDRDLILFGGYMLGRARELGITIRYGGDWNGDWRNSDNGFQDLDHFEERLVG